MTRICTRSVAKGIKKVSMDSGIIEKVGFTTLRDFFIGVDKEVNYLREIAGFAEKIVI